MVAIEDVFQIMIAFGTLVVAVITVAKKKKQPSPHPLIRVIDDYLI